MGLVLKHVSKSYDGVQVVKDVSLCVDGKHFVVLAGPSGCGKTTLLNMIAGFLQPDQGRIMIDEIDITNKKPSEREIAMVFQDAALFPHMSVYDNIVYGLRNKDLAKEIMSITKMLGINELLHRKARNLSTGQKQRVSIARALVRNPKLFLMDEAFSALDTRLKSQLRIELMNLYQKMAATFLYVTHDHNEAMTLADVLIIMKDGKLQQVGKPLELYRNPSNLFVANFLGRYELNVILGRVIQNYLEFADTVIELSDKFVEQEVYVCIRSEDVHIDENGYCGIVTLLEQLGDEVVYHVLWNKQVLHIKGSVNDLLKQNQVVYFQIDWSKILVFQRNSELRIDVNKKRCYKVK